MGEKENNGGDHNKEGKKESAGDKSSITIVLKTDLHCEGCASKLIKSIRSVAGVETVMMTGDGRKITVLGNVDPAELREKVEQRTHQKVELIVSPQAKSGADAAKLNGNSAGGDKKKNESKDTKKDDKSDQKKSKEKELPETTAVFKVNLHCDGCVQKLHKTVTKTKGYKEMKIDKQKDLITVTGTMDMKALAALLQKQLKKDVEIIPPKKETEKKEKGGGGGVEEKMEGNRMLAQLQMLPNFNPNPNSNPNPNPNPSPYSYPFPFMLGSGAGDQFGQYPLGQYHAPQLFSDENPNACSAM